MRRCAFGAAALAASFLSVIVAGCESRANSLDRVEFLEASRSSDRPNFAVPRSLADLDVMGLPYLPGSEFDADDVLNTVDDRGLVRAYTVRLYAPGEIGDATAFYLRSLRKAKSLASGADFGHIAGSSAMGDEVEVRFAPAAEPKKTLVVAVLSVRK